MKYTVQYGVKQNNRGYKPNEDFCIADEENLIFVVTDGVTQSREDYTDGLEKSDAGMAAELTAKAIHESLLSDSDPERGLFEGARLAIKRVAEYNQTSRASYPPATCLVAGCIRGDRFHYAYMGDSIIFLLRGGAKIQLAEQQTRYLGLYRKLTGQQTIPKDDIYKYHTNNIASPGAYGVVLGDMRAMDLLCVSSIALEPGDRIIISSDGLDQYLFYKTVDTLRRETPEEMLEASTPFDIPPFSTFADDKSIILIDAAQ